MPSRAKQRLFRSVCLAFMGIMLVTLFWVHNTHPITDGDVFFHLKYGEYHVQQKTLLMDHSIYSWTPALQYAPYCTWAADIFLYAMYQLGGWPLLFTFKYLCMFLPVMATWMIAKKTGMGAHLFTFFVLVIVQLTVATAAYIKPEIISLVFFVSVSFLYFYIKIDRARKKKSWLFFLYPLVFLLWANIHGVVFFGLMLLAAIIFGETLNYFMKSGHAFLRKDMIVLIISGVLSLAATFLNPYGTNLHRSFLKLSTGGMPSRVENAIRSYQPLTENITNPTAEQYLECWGIMVILVTILFFANGRKCKDWDFGVFVPNVFLGVLYYLINRTTFYWPAFWAMSLFYFSGKDCLDIPGLIMNAKPLIKYGLIGIVATLSLFFSIRAMYYDYYVPSRWSYFGLGFNHLQPVQESAFLKKSRIGTKLFNTYNTGSYLLFDLFPSYKVFIDSRYFPYKNDNIFGKYKDIADGRISLEDLESELGFDTALMEHSFPALDDFLVAKNWKPAFYGITGVVFVKNNIDLPSNMQTHDMHRFDDLRNLSNTLDLVRTAQNLNDLESSAYIISIMEKKMGRLIGYQIAYNYLSLCQEGLEAYVQGDFGKAFKIFRHIGFEDRNIRINALLRQLMNHKAEAYVRKGQYEEALNLLKPILINFPGDNDVMYDVAVVACLAAQKNPYAPTVNKIKWREMLQQWLSNSPKHEYAGIAEQLLEGRGPESLPLILNSRIQNEN